MSYEAFSNFVEAPADGGSVWVWGRAPRERTQGLNGTGPGGGLGERSPQAQLPGFRRACLARYLCMLEVLRVLYKPHLVPSHLDSVCVGGPWGLMAHLEVGSGAARKSWPSPGVWPARLQDQQEEATVVMRSFALPTSCAKEQQESQCWQRGSAPVPHAICPCSRPECSFSRTVGVG